MKMIERRPTSPTETVVTPHRVRQSFDSPGGLAQFHTFPLLSLLEIPYARKFTILTCFLIGLALGWIAILVWPRTYVSQAELLFQVGRESVALDPSVTTGQTMVLQRSQEEDINSALQILKSRRVLELVIQDLGAEAIMEGVVAEADSGESPVSPVKRLVQQAREVLSSAVDLTGLREEISPQELALMTLEGSIYFESPKKSSVVMIEATSKTPEMAQAIADSTVRAFQQLHRDATRTSGSLDFFTSQTELAAQRLRAAQDRRRAFLADRQAVSLEAKQDILKQQIAATEIDSLNAARDLKQAEAKSRQLELDIAQLEDVTMAAQQNTSGTTWAALRQRVNELELREVRESAMYAEGNQKLLATRQELEGARQILREFQSNDRPDTNTVANPLKQKLEEELKLNNANITGIRAAIALRAEQLRHLKDEVDSLLQDTNLMTAIERDIEQYTANLRLLRDKQDESKLIEDLQLGGVTSVNQFQPATFVQRAISPNKKLMMAGFLLLGLISGLGLAFYAEANSRTFRTAAMVAHRLSVPVIGEVRKLAGLRRRSAMIERTGASEEMMQVCQSALAQVLATVSGAAGHERAISVGVIGIEPGNGASTFALGLAICSSEDFQLPTVLVEADRIGRSISSEFGLSGVPGLCEMAAGEATAEKCIQPACRQSLCVVASSATSNSGEPLVGLGDEFARAIESIQQTTEVVIVDLPPASTPDKLVGLAQRVDQLIVVIEAGKSDVAAVHRLLRNLEMSPVGVVGVVLNKTKRHWLSSLVKIR
jgi:uncharacterized protein involved in exopolysaccharide biosynthesis/Mrp family chromosome partitioning ATPase